MRLGVDNKRSYRRSLAVLTVVGGIAVFAGAGARAGDGAGAARAVDGRCEPGEVLVAAAAAGLEGPAFCLPMADGPTGASRVDTLYSTIAAEITGVYVEELRRGEARGVTVVCWSPEDWQALAEEHARNGKAGFSGRFGYVVGSRAVANLSPQICSLLDRIAYGDERPLDEGAARAVTVLAHEALHVAGETGEGLAECYAMQLAETTARQLGAEPGYGRDLGALRYVGYLERYEWTRYQAGGCEQGLRHDLDLDPSIWS